MTPWPRRSPGGIRLEWLADRRSWPVRYQPPAAFAGSFAPPNALVRGCSLTRTTGLLLGERRVHTRLMNSAVDCCALRPVAAYERYQRSPSPTGTNHTRRRLRSGASLGLSISNHTSLPSGV